MEETKKKSRVRGNVSSNAELLLISSYRSVSTIGGYMDIVCSSADYDSPGTSTTNIDFLFLCTTRKQLPGQ